MVALLLLVATAPSAQAGWTPGPDTLSVFAGSGETGQAVAWSTTSPMQGPTAVASDRSSVGEGAYFVDGGTLHQASVLKGSGTWIEALTPITGVGDGVPATLAVDAVASFPRGHTGFPVALGVDRTHRVVVLVTRAGATLLAGSGTAGSPRPGPAALSPLQPVDLAGGWDGRTVYVTDASGALVAVDRDARSLRVVAGPGTDVPLTRPTLVTAAPDGSLTVLDDATGRVVRLTPGGTVTPVAGPGTATPLVEATDLDTGPDGTLYIADGGAATVVAIRADGTSRVLAGTGRSGRPVPGPATTSPLGRPTGVSVRDDGQVLVADEAARRLLLITPEPLPALVEPDPGVHRWAGADRIATAVAASRELSPFPGRVRSAVIASADTYADALAGARLAAQTGGPLLLTDRESLRADTVAELDRILTPDATVYFLGGGDRIGTDVDVQVSGLRPRASRIPLSGADRFETASQVADQVERAGGTDAETPIFLANGWNFPDGLAVSALASSTGGVVLLTDGDRLPAATSEYLQRNDPTGQRTVPVGGAAADAVLDLPPGAADAALGNAVVGADRYETAAALAAVFAPETPAGGPLPVGLATGQEWPDALVGAAVMGRLQGPVLLTPAQALAPAASDVLQDLRSAGATLGTGLVFGGTDRVPEAVRAPFASGLQG